MHISLTPELEGRIKARVATGLYNNASEVVREALRFMESHEDWIHEVKLERLRQDLRVGQQELEAGQGQRLESRAALDRFFADLDS
ncbi:type II toxin-antitoxin system ParD family antitoxin [Marinospirillum sp.]|uniref:type II toxin-antitoxin system ParD family antitoxin n=1 Tax=Marinospirillum sp. TaxID=2183934 RepID=UPI0028709C0F|nr:type II toxin-antitoxin system ParD family antitoxin [Marinospirillum sp.]MDR9468805.1 type II toxin-antitoxin system ParD family antitoxin [Marinospirillum sp.]